MKRKTLFVLALVAALVAGIGQTALASLSTKTAKIEDITIKFRRYCDAAIKQVNLGDIDPITLEDAGTSSLMNTQFTVSAEAKASEICNCMELHWLQTIWYDACPAKYKGAKLVYPDDFPVIDPPNGGWDYMYPGGDRTKPPKPEYSIFIDNEPWYFNDEAQTTRYDSNGDGKIDNKDDFLTIPCDKYHTHDQPGDCSNGGMTGFSTYLVATATQTCPLPDCLQPKEILLLAGFDWTTSLADIEITDTFKAPSPFDVQDITNALGHAGFTGWTVVDDKAICCIPEPASFIVWTVWTSLGIVGITVGRSRQRRKAA